MSIRSFILLATLASVTVACDDPDGPEEVLDIYGEPPSDAPENEVGQEQVDTPVAAKPARPEEAGSPVQVESDCGGHSGIYCVTIHLKDGAKLKPFMASSPLSGGAQHCRGWANRFSAKSVKQFSQSSLSYDGFDIKNARVILSGSFNDNAGAPAFPQKVKSGGWISTYGYECRPEAGADAMRILQIRNSEGRAFVEPFSLNKFNDPSSAPEAIVGLSPSFSMNAWGPSGRNFAGLTNPYNGGYGTVVFVIAPDGLIKGIKSATAVSILKGKGCPDSQIVQFDGSSVAQLSEKKDGVWVHRVENTRSMPQAFAAYLP